MTDQRPSPSGASHEVGPGEMFFSATDAKGIIKEANTVFVRLSRYGRDDLVGAPHNIIRHPSMPGGAFLLMWDTLESGRPFCAYVDNLAADGRRNTVFATINPLGDDYLSVRVRPQRTDLLDAARGLYQLVRPRELEARAQGTTAHDAAVLGLGQLAELLAGAGFPSYDEFIWVALPAEFRARAESGEGFPARPSATGTMADVLAASGRLHTRLAQWTDQLDDLQALADALVAGGADVQATMADSEATAAGFTEAAASQQGFSPILGTITLWTQMIGEINGLLGGLVDRMAELRRSAAQTRFRIALGALQSETVGQFACELIDGVPGSDAARPAIGQLVRALREGITDAEDAMRANATLAAQVADEIDLLAELIGVPATLLDSWQGMAAGRDEAAVARILPRVAEVVARSQADADALRRLAERCRGVRLLDDATVVAELDTIDRLAAAA